jgi:hypothetical protein
MLAPLKHVIPVTLIQRQRLLPIQGKVLARKGQTVGASDVVAEARVAPEHILLDIARGLGVSPDEADANLQRQAGDAVDEGDVIAGPVGIGRRVVRAPKKGKVALAGGGQLLLESEGRLFELRAGMNGIISDLLPDQGVVVQTVGALIQGVWGNGRMDYGLLHVLARTPEEELRPDRLDVSLRGAVILGGPCQDPEVLIVADELPLRGLILASMSSELVPLALKTRCPVIVLEGFGDLPMSPNAFKLLSTSQRREVSVVAERWDPVQGLRPEVIIPLPTESVEPVAPDAAELRVGQQVRITHSLHMGRVGTITDLLPQGVTLPSGIEAAAAQVRLEGNETTMVPLVNLEIMSNI